MVSFSCEACGDVLTKKKLDPHRRGCRGATFTCIDCMVYFPGVEYRSHTSCMTEEQKYQGALYKPKQNKKQQPQQQQQQQQQQQPQQQQQQQPAMNSHRMGMANTLALQPFVEDVGEDKEYESWHEYEITDKSPSGPPPEAPTPPSAADDEHVNVFDFLDNSQTPTASNVSRTRDRKPSNADDTTSLVRYETKTGELLEPASLMDQDGEPLVQYGTGPVPTADFVTPKPKTERRRSSKERGTQKDKKRKRLHIDVTGDQIMADAPPVLHSGLTGGLKNMMRPTLPPSPDYSGDNIADLSPTSPLKKSKHSRHHKSSHHHHQSTTSIFGMIAGAPPKTKSSKRKSSSSSSSKKHSHKHEKKSPKPIEYRPGSKDGKGDHDGQMVVFKPRADVFLSFVNKGPESERGCSMNKALKRFHRERQAAGDNVPKIKEEKELWRSLRLRRNDRGEIVLFCEE